MPVQVGFLILRVVSDFDNAEIGQIGLALGVKEDIASRFYVAVNVMPCLMDVSRGHWQSSLQPLSRSSWPGRLDKLPGCGDRPPLRYSHHCIGDVVFLSCRHASRASYNLDNVRVGKFTQGDWYSRIKPLAKWPIDKHLQDHLIGHLDHYMAFAHAFIKGLIDIPHTALSQFFERAIATVAEIDAFPGGWITRHEEVPQLNTGKS